ncbi:MAG: carbon-nitrogen hydrolase [Proteobacteria bacterium]|nr:MAG: carbon-nitrogen hydrolase [Pseudomonadota bacterium]
MKITCIGLDSKLYEVKQNLAHAKNIILSSPKSDVFVLPELFTTGFYPKDIASHVKTHEGIEEIFSNLAKEKNAHIIAGSIPFSRGGNLYNTSLIFDKNGSLIAKYDKTHLFTNMNEDKYFTRGDKICTFRLENVRCGIMICYDLRFPELASLLGEIDILFIVSAWPKERLSQLKILAQARAIETQSYVCLCNSSSQIRDVKFAGNSMIINPLGEILARGGESEHVINYKLDLSILPNIKKAINVKKDRRRDLY